MEGGYWRPAITSLTLWMRMLTLAKTGNMSVFTAPLTLSCPPRGREDKTRKGKGRKKN